MNKLTAELLHQLKSAAQEEIICREASDTSDAWQDLASPENILALIDIARPVECPFPCGWKELLRIAMSDGAFLSKDLLEGGEIKDFHRHAALSNTDRLVRVITAILNAQREDGKPTPPQIDNDDWIKWGGGDCPVPVNVMVEYKMRDGWVGSCFADDLRWRNASNPREYPAADIIAYRVIENDGREG